MKRGLLEVRRKGLFWCVGWEGGAGSCGDTWVLLSLSRDLAVSISFPSTALMISPIDQARRGTHYDGGWDGWERGRDGLGGGCDRISLPPPPFTPPSPPPLSLSRHSPPTPPTDEKCWTKLQEITSQPKQALVTS